MVDWKPIVAVCALVASVFAVAEVRTARALLPDDPLWVDYDRVVGVAAE